MNNEINIQTCVDISPDDDKVLREGIVGFNEKVIGSRGELYAVYARNSSDEIIGGARVYFHPMSVFIDILWVRDDQRGKKVGSQILTEAEREGVKRGARYATLDTFDFQALDFYIKQGYQQIGVIKDYLEGHDRIFLRKSIP